MNRMGADIALFFFFIESEKPLAQIIQANEKNHPHHHGDILLDCFTIPFQKVPDSRLGDAVSKQIADEDVDGEACDGLEVGFPVLEGETLIEEIAQDAAEKVVGSGRNPITEMEHIVKDEHDRCSEQCVDDSHEDESSHCIIEFQVHDGMPIKQ